VPLDTTRYQIEESICRGHSRWAKVYDSLVNQPVKAEWYWLEDDVSQEGLDRLRREHLAVAKLCHPGIVRAYQCQQDAGQTLLLSEPSSEGSLRELLEAGPIALESALEIVRGAAELLDYAHQHRIVHRGLEPEHILVGSRVSARSVKIRQFGIAWILNLRYLQRGKSIPTKGVSYCSPEQVSGLKVDRRCDIFSLGVILYEMLVGKRPFRYEWSMQHLVWEICNSPVNFPADFDPKFRVILERCLAKDRESRFQTIAELMDALGLSQQGWSQPELAQPHIVAGNQHYQDKRFEEALQEWTEAVALDRYNAITHNNLGTAYDSLGDLEQAERFYRQALQLTPYQMVGYYNLASVQSRLNQWDDAALNYRRSAILAPEHAASHYNLARCYHYLGQISESQASLERACQLNPELDNPPAWE
jgi:serine/threonine protein kinase